jgi:hypothetical protein
MVVEQLIVDESAQNYCIGLQYDHAEIQHAYINKANMHPKPYPDMHTVTRVNNWRACVNHVIDVAKQ